MNFTQTIGPRAMPDLVNERWRNRYMLNVIFRRQVIRTYPVLPLVGAAGTIEVDQDDGNLNVDWNVQE